MRIPMFTIKALERDDIESVIDFEKVKDITK